MNLLLENTGVLACCRNCSRTFIASSPWIRKKVLVIRPHEAEAAKPSATSGERKTTKKLDHER